MDKDGGRYARDIALLVAHRLCHFPLQNTESYNVTILTQFAESVIHRAKLMPTHTENLLHGAVGVAGEAGELLDAIKKAWVYNKPLDEQNLIEELGDVLWYVQHIANHLNVPLETIMYANMEKLKRRYPEGYSDQAAQARADKTGEKK